MLALWCGGIVLMCWVFGLGLRIDIVVVLDCVYVTTFTFCLREFNLRLVCFVFLCWWLLLKLLLDFGLCFVGFVGWVFVIAT